MVEMKSWSVTPETFSNLFLMLQEKPQRSGSAKDEPSLQNGVVGLALRWAATLQHPKLRGSATPDSVGVTNLCEMSKMPGQASHNGASSDPDTDVLPKTLHLWPAPGQSQPEALTLLLRTAKRGPKHITIANLLWQHSTNFWDVAIAYLAFITGTWAFLAPSVSTLIYKLAPHTPNLPWSRTENQINHFRLKICFAFLLFLPFFLLLLLAYKPLHQESPL